MKQQINFYAAEFKPVKDLMSLDNMLLIWLVGLVISVLLYVYESDQLERLEAQRNSEQTQQNRIQSQLGELQSSFSRRGDLGNLNEVLADKKGHYSTLEAVLRQLDSRSGGMSAGVAGIMDDLTDLKLKSIWLTEITINQGQLSVMGETRDPKQIPLLIKQLEAIDGLSDRRFAKLEVMIDPQRDIHVFSLQSIDFIAPEAAQGAGQ